MCARRSFKTFESGSRALRTRRQPRQARLIARVSVDNGGAAAPTIHHPVASSQAASEADEDIVFVGTANECRLPHMRQHCPDHKFVQDVWVTINQEETLTDGNLAFCHLCYCYVCDKPAKDCTMWGATNIGGFHSHASDAGMYAPHWHYHRMEAKNQNGPKQQEKALPRRHMLPSHDALRNQPIHPHHHVLQYDHPPHVMTIPVLVPPVLFPGRKMLVAPPRGGTKLVIVPQGVPPGVVSSVRVLVPPLGPHMMSAPYPRHGFY